MWLVAQVDENEIRRMMSVREAALLGAQLSCHVTELMLSHLTNDGAKRTLRRLIAAWQMRLKILGEIAHSHDGSIVPNVVLTELRMSAVTLENDVDVVKQEIVHDMESIDLSHICPDNLLDFLLVFLEAIIRSILPRVPNELRYIAWSQECISEARELVNNLRLSSLLIKDLPTRSPDTSISDMCFDYRYLPKNHRGSIHQPIIDGS
jgi:hypothetical protein